MRLLIALSALYVCIAEIRVERPKFETGYGVMTIFSDPDCSVPQAQQIYAIGGCEANEDGSSRKVESIEQSTISSVWNINMGLYSDKFCSVYVGETALPLNKECTDGTRFAYQSEFNPAFHGIVLK